MTGHPFYFFFSLEEGFKPPDMKERSRDVLPLCNRYSRVSRDALLKEERVRLNVRPSEACYSSLSL